MEHLTVMEFLDSLLQKSVQSQYNPAVLTVLLIRLLKEDGFADREIRQEEGEDAVIQLTLEDLAGKVSCGVLTEWTAHQKVACMAVEISEGKCSMERMDLYV